MNVGKVFVIVLLFGFAPAAVPQAERNDDQAKLLQRLAKDRVEAARKTYRVLWDNYRDGFRGSSDSLYRWSKRLLEAERQASKQSQAQVAAFQGHRNRMAELERLIRKVGRVGQATVDELSAAEFYRVEGEFWLAQAETDNKDP